MTIDRRQLMTAATAGGLAAVLPANAWPQEQSGDSWRKAILAYLEGLARPDGGYGWDGQEHSHLTPTFAAIGCYKLLGVEPPKKDTLADYVRTHHPRALKGRLEQEMRAFEWQQIQSLVWLGADVTSFRDVVESWKAPFAYPKQYEQHGHPVFQQEVAAILARQLLNIPLVKRTPEYMAYIDYLDFRRRKNGSFNNTPAADGSDGHVLNTWWGLQALAAMSLELEQKAETIAWLQRCQLPGGGFTYQPKAEIGSWDDAAYTWAAVKSLALFGAQPLERQACVDYLKSLWKGGGFSDRPGWEANPLATYYALDALVALDALPSDSTLPKPKSTPRTFLPVNLKVFSIQLEAHGRGSPAEAVDLADALKIDLWGAKNAKPEWIARAQAIADQEHAAVKFFVANEEYGTWIDVPGMGTYSHMSDVIAHVAADVGSSLASGGVMSWPEFRYLRLGEGTGDVVARRQSRETDDPRARIDKLLRLARTKKAFSELGGRLIWQFGENEPLVRMLLDDSIQKGGAYAAISTYHFGNPDFTNTEPFLMRYRGQLPFVALQDAHGEEPWWFSDMTEGFRTLFLTEQPTWDGWLSALQNNWVVSVRHDAVSGGKTWMHGMPEIIEVVKKQWRQWQWWDNPAIERPLVSVVALTPQDEFESGRPERGIALRVRCAWQNTTQGLPKKPITEFVKLVVDAKPVEAQHIIRRRPNDAIEDDYHLFTWPDTTAGMHTATVTIRHLGTSAETNRSIQFTV